MKHAWLTPILAPFFFAAVFESCTTARAQAKAGDALFEAGDFAGARAAYEMAAKDSPEDAAIGEKLKVARVFANLDAGRKLVFEDRYLEAIERFEDALRADPQSQAASKWIQNAKEKYVIERIRFGFDALAEENFSEAMESFQRALLYEPKSEDAMAGLVRIREILDKRLAKSEDYFLRGLRDSASGLVDRAAAHFAKAEHFNPSDSDTAIQAKASRFRLAERKFLEAEGYEKNGNFGAALVQYRSIRAIDPDFPGLAEKIGALEVELKAKDLLSRGKHMLLRGDFSAARNSLEEAKGLAISEPTLRSIEEILQEILEKENAALYLAGRSMERTMRFQEAVDRYEELLRKTPFYEDAIARLDLCRGAVAKAVELYEKGCQAQEEDKKEEALQAFREIQVFYPKFRDVAERIEKLQG